MQSYIHQKAVVEALLGFNSAYFFAFLLPPVIFWAGLSVEKKVSGVVMRLKGKCLQVWIAGTFLSCVLTFRPFSSLLL